LKDIEPLPAGVPRIEVRFLIDADGILNVSARDLRTGKEQSVEVKPSYGLTEEQVEAMILESYQYARQDVEERLLREVRLEADRILAAVEKARFEEAYSQLSDAEQEAVERAVNELLMVYHGADPLLIRAHTEKLNQATLKLAEVVMSRAVRAALKGTKV